MNEEAYEMAFIKLYEAIVKIINEKTLEINNYSNQKIEFLSFQNVFLTTLINESLDLSNDLYESCNEIENDSLKMKIKQRIAQFENNVDYKKNINTLKNYLDNDVIKTIIKTE
jgi:hypothetical protein